MHRVIQTLPFSGIAESAYIAVSRKRIVGMVERDLLPEKWIAFQIARAKVDLHSEELEAYEELERLVEKDPASALEVIEEILERDASEVITNAVGVGPIENLLCAHGPRVIEIIETMAEKSRAFRKALRVVDVWEEECPVYDRFYSIPGVEFPPENESG